MSVPDREADENSLFTGEMLSEGFSNSMLEALAVGLPMVASDSPEMRQILGESGVLIQDPTATNSARTLDALLSNKQTIQNLSILSVQKARSYSWKNVLDATEDVYKEVCIV